MPGPGGGQIKLLGSGGNFFSHRDHVKGGLAQRISGDHSLGVGWGSILMGLCWIKAFLALKAPPILLLLWGWQRRASMEEVLV